MRVQLSPNAAGLLHPAFLNAAASSIGLSSGAMTLPITTIANSNAVSMIQFRRSFRQLNRQYTCFLQSEVAYGPGIL